MKNVPTINVSLETLIRECSLHKRPDYDMFLDFRLKNRENIHEVFKYKKFNDDFTDYVTCYNDGSEIIGVFRPSFDEYLHKLALFLGVPLDKMIGESEYYKKLKERIERLSKVTSERELEIEFPELYKDLIQGRRYMLELDQMEKKTSHPLEEERHYFYACALKRRLDRFIATQVELYTRFLEYRNQYLKKIETTNYNNYIRTYFDKNKVAMYITHLYLKICESSTDPKVIRKYLNLVERYLQSNYSKEVRLQDDNGEIIHFHNIEYRYEKLKNQQIEDRVDWIIIPNTKNYTGVKHKAVQVPRVTLFNYLEMEELRKKGSIKQSFYEQTPYLAKVHGLHKYQGYIGYIYPNGEVILEKEHNPDRPKSDRNNAIYNIKAINFEALSQLDKAKLKKCPGVKRIVHAGNWQKRVEDIIEREGTKEEQEQAKQLIKRIKEKK